MPLEDYEEVGEGAVSVLVPRGHAVGVPKAKARPLKRAHGFYNPGMSLNRDVAVLFVRSFFQGRSGIWACEPLGGCGVRSVRLAREVEAVARVVVNDIDPAAAALTQLNVLRCGVGGKVEVQSVDANLLLCYHARRGRRFHYVDIDPYGSPVEFVESALRATASGGVVALTATDMATLCGVYPRACLRRYGSRLVVTEYGHEVAVRVLLGFVARVAARMEMAAVPRFCHSTDYYVRVYVEVSKEARRANESLASLGYILHCFRCLERRTVSGVEAAASSECAECSGEAEALGPLWTGGLWDGELCERMVGSLEASRLQNKERVRRMLELIRQEAPGPPTYHVLSRFSDHYGIQTPRIGRVLEALREKGYRASRTHFNPVGLRTDAPLRVLRPLVERLGSPTAG